MSTPRVYGPRSGASARPLSTARAAVLERLKGQPEPLTLASLVTVTGLHENTLREHLTALVHRGVVHRHRAEPGGRGRPAWLYSSADDESTGSEYAGLAAALTAAIVRTADNPVAVAAAAGEEWGRELAIDRGATSLSAVAARAEVLSLLDDQGFAPEQDPEHPAQSRLTRCPLLEAAYRNQEVVCAVHLGIVRGALTQYGADPTGSTLMPFSEPGACRLVLPPLEKNG